MVSKKQPFDDSEEAAEIRRKAAEEIKRINRKYAITGKRGGKRWFYYYDTRVFGEESLCLVYEVKGEFSFNVTTAIGLRTLSNKYNARQRVAMNWKAIRRKARSTRGIVSQINDPTT